MSITSRRGRSTLRRSAALVSTGLLTAVLTIGAGAAARAQSDPEIDVSTYTATSGGVVTVYVAGFPPGGSLEFALDDTVPLTTYPLSGGLVAADADGRYKGTAVLPDGLEPGEHSLSAAHYGDANYGAFAYITVVAQPASSVDRQTQSLSDYLATGVTATFTGFAPGAPVSFGISTPATGDSAGPDAEADANGAVTLRFVPEAGTNYANVGTYNLTASSDEGAIVAEPLSFTVTADTPETPSPGTTTPTTAPAPVAGPATPVKHAATFTG